MLKQLSMLNMTTIFTFTIDVIILIPISGMSDGYKLVGFMDNILAQLRVLVNLWMVIGSV